MRVIAVVSHQWTVPEPTTATASVVGVVVVTCGASKAYLRDTLAICYTLKQLLLQSLVSLEATIATVGSVVPAVVVVVAGNQKKKKKKKKKRELKSNCNQTKIPLFLSTNNKLKDLKLNCIKFFPC